MGLKVSEGPVSNFTKVVASSANTAITTCTVTAPATPQRHYVNGLSVFIKGAAAASDINVYLRDGASSSGTVIWQGAIGSGAPRGDALFINFTHPVACTAATAATLDVDAGGASVVCVASLWGYTA